MPGAIAPAADLDEVLARLDEVVAQTITDRDPHGIFAALYRQMTLRVQAGIAAGLFDDGARMERFDTLFANRYFAALTAHRAGEPTPRCWEIAFTARDEQDNIATQHMLLGVNAHINFDLPIAAFLTAPGEIAQLQRDFERINDIIAALLDEAQEVLNRNSSGMRLIDLLGGGVDEWLAAFSIAKMREHAWEEATELVGLSDQQRARAEKTCDRRVAGLGLLLIRPSRPLQTVVDLIRLSERGKTADIITGLDAIPVDLTALRS